MILSRAGTSRITMLRVHVCSANPAGGVGLQPLQGVGVKQHRAAHSVSFAEFFHYSVPICDADFPQKGKNRFLPLSGVRSLAGGNGQCLDTFNFLRTRFLNLDLYVIRAPFRMMQRPLNHRTRVFRQRVFRQDPFRAGYMLALPLLRSACAHLHAVQSHIPSPRSLAYPR